MAILSLVLVWVFLISPIISQNYTCENASLKGVVQPVNDGEHGRLQSFVKCLHIPVATIRVNISILELRLGDDITDFNECKNDREDGSKTHFEIMNGRDEIFRCSEATLDQGYSFEPQISSTNNSLSFNMTVGRSRKELVPTFKVLYSLTACSDVTGGVITRIQGATFNINCTKGREGIDGDGIYNCVDGFWERNGKVVTPKCTEPTTESQTSTTPEDSEITKLPDLEKEDKNWKELIIGLAVACGVLLLGYIYIVPAFVGFVCHIRKKRALRRKNKANNAGTELENLDNSGNEMSALMDVSHDDGGDDVEAQLAADVTERPKDELQNGISHVPRAPDYQEP